ncbi:MAG: choice-of-anchor R domain-containing protein, partial [Verrucomicrobiota bacterium]
MKKTILLLIAAALGLAATPGVCANVTLFNNIDPSGTYPSDGGQTGAVDYGNWPASQFTTDGHAYSLTSVVLMMQQFGASTAQVDIYSNVGNHPGVSVGTLVSPGSYADTPTPTTFTASLSGVPLAANSSYWVVLRASDQTSKLYWWETSTATGTGVGFTSTWTRSADYGSTWFADARTTYPQQMQVYADVVVVGPVTRTAAQSGAWNDPATWGGTVPAPGDDIVIPAGIAVALTNNPAIGNLTIAGTCNLGTNTLQISGNFTNTGTFTPGTGTVELTGGSNQVLAASAPGELTFYKLTVNKDPATNTVTATSKLKATKKLTLTKGKLISASDYGDVFIDTEGTLELTSDITVSGNFTNNGNFYNNDNGVTFDGGVEQNLSLAATTWFSRLTVTAGTTLIETETGDYVQVAQLSNLGVIRKTQPVPTLSDYYFGLAGNSGAGLKLDVTSLAGAAPLTAIQVDRVDSNPPNAQGTNVTGIYWTITGVGSSFTATLILPQNELADPQVCRYRNSAWDWARSGFDATTVTRTDLTAFGEFAVFNDPKFTASTTTTLDASLNPSTYGVSVTFTATVSPSDASGTVTFKDGTSTLGTGTLSGGVATFTTNGLSVGSHSLTAQYAGDTSYSASVSSALTQTINPVGPPPTPVDGLVPNGPIYAIVSTADATYLGGNFTRIGPSRPNGVPVDTTSGQPVAAFPKVNGTVFCCAPDGAGGWYIGGDFTQVGALNCARLAHIKPDGTVDATWIPQANATVSALAVSGSAVYVGGVFTSITNSGVATTRNYLAAIGTDGTLAAWNPDPNSPVNALAVSGPTVYVGGQFQLFGGTTYRNYLAAIGTDGTVGAWNPNANATVYALAVSGSTVYAGGMFTQIGGNSRRYLAAIGTSGTGTVTAWNPSPYSYVYALAVSDTTVYVGGDFTSLGGITTRNRLAAFSTTDGSLAAWNPNANDSVYALAVSGTNVYAGGSFQTIGGTPRNALAAIGTNGTLAAWAPSPGGMVWALALSGTTAYVGGQFTTIGGTTRNYLAAINPDGTLGSWNPNANSTVNALAVSGSTVYAGGSFTSITNSGVGYTRNRLAALSTTDGTVGPWNPDANNQVLALAVSGSTVYVGGGFTSITN